MSGVVLPIHKNVKYKPSFISKITSGAPLQIDINNNFLFYDTFTFGVSYRYNAAISALAGFQINNHWFIGYGYDRETTRLSNFNDGSHEIFLQYQFNRRKAIISPRFF
jgi:type IX secretion system PorP/SprF family membrane protein